jgi:hypothetical protein
VTPFVGHAALVVVKLGFGQKMYFVATDHRFPIESVRFVQYLLGESWAPIDLCRRAKQSVYFSDIVILAGFIIGEDDGGMPFFFAEWIH